MHIIKTLECKNTKSNMNHVSGWLHAQVGDSACAIASCAYLNAVFTEGVVVLIVVVERVAN